MKTSPTARSMKHLRELGFIVAKVEQKIHMPKAPFPITRDCFGFGDLLIAKPDFGAALIQVTATGDVNRRFRKIQGIPADADDEKQLAEASKAHLNAIIWIAAGNRIFVHGWAKRGPRNQKKTWQLIEREVKRSDL